MHKEDSYGSEEVEEGKRKKKEGVYFRIYGERRRQCKYFGDIENVLKILW